jgi:hypothetical protein
MMVLKEDVTKVEEYIELDITDIDIYDEK